jgi:hypothetical protein
MDKIKKAKAFSIGFRTETGLHLGVQKAAPLFVKIWFVPG